MVLESNQFNQLVEEVKKALLVGSQGVGDVEIVDSLADIVSLPALRLAGMEESVVEAPLELLSAPAEEAAEEVRKADHPHAHRMEGGEQAGVRAERIGVLDRHEHDPAAAGGDRPSWYAGSAGLHDNACRMSVSSNSWCCCS